MVKEEKLSEYEKQQLIIKMIKKPVMFSKDLNNKVLVFSETIIYKDGTADIRKYYIDKGASLKNPETVVYVDYYSEEKRRETAKKEFKEKRRRIM